MEELQGYLSEIGLSVSVSPEKGRCLFTARNFSPGEIVISQQPYVSEPKDSSGAPRCEVCFSSDKFKKCSACHFVWYCGSTCQKSDWMFHRVECQTLKA